jgi:hypothetical protein
LLWAAAGRSYGLELCIDARGRLVEAVDRRGVMPNFFSLVAEPQAAKFRISPTLFASLLARVQRGG